MQTLKHIGRDILFLLAFGFEAIRGHWRFRKAPKWWKWAPGRDPEGWRARPA